MASKFGGAAAAKNQWVMQQNMARHKSALSLGYKPRQPNSKAAPPAKPLPPADAIEQPKTPAP